MDALRKSKPYSESDAFLDIMSMADERGYLSFTTRQLRDRWGWGSSKLTEFVKRMKSWNVIIGAKTEQKRSAVYRINTRFLGVYKSENGAKMERVYNREYADICDRVIEYFNSRCGKGYKNCSKTAKEFIAARLEEGFSESDFYTVIDKKANEWIDTKWERYLRPYTLFGDKFDDYLNQPVAEHKSDAQQEFDDFCERIDRWAKQKEMEERNREIR